MEKIGTPECQLFIAAHYAQKDIDTLADDWILEKKYKNFHGFTCRDFFNEGLNIRSVVVAEPLKDRYLLSVIENASFKIFLEAMAKKSLYYYVPAVTNNGLVFYFEKTMTFDATGELDQHPSKQTPYLLKKISSLFKEEQFTILEKSTSILFTLPVEEVIQKLEKNHFSFNAHLFDLLNKNIYQPFVTDMVLSIYDFPEDNNLTSEQAIEKMFAITSQNKNLEDQDYARIKNLLRKVNANELNSISHLMMGFRDNDDIRLETLIEYENNRKNNNSLLKELLEK